MGKTYKWVMLALLSCAFFFHQADRALFGLLTIPIQQELGLTDVQIGWINTVLSWTLAGMALGFKFTGVETYNFGTEISVDDGSNAKNINNGDRKSVV